MNDLRHVIIHIHIFKNAGTSIDRLLEKSLGEGWIDFDKGNPGAIYSLNEVGQFVWQRPNRIAFSSHQVRFPLAVLEKIIFYPIVLLRHPLDRIQSCYHFEVHHQKVMNPETTSLEDFVVSRLNTPGINSICNLQTAILCDNRFISEQQRKDELGQQQLAEAKRTINSLPAFGIVERFDDSIAKFSNWLKPVFPDLELQPVQANMRQNRTQDFEKRIEEIKASLQPSVLEGVLEQNALDLALYEHASKRFNQMRDVYINK